MSIEWQPSEHVFTYTENTDIYLEFGFNAPTAKLLVLSSTLPSELKIETLKDKFTIRGKLPMVPSETHYYLSVRLAEYDENPCKPTSFKDNYVEIISTNKKVQWDVKQQSIIHYAASTPMNYQLKLLNTNGNEVFRKVDGELPKGIALTPQGKLVGEVEESLISIIPYNFTIDVYVGDKPIEPSLRRKFQIFVEDIPEDVKPTWVTKEGKLGSLNFGDTSDLRVLAYDMADMSSVTYHIDTTLGQDFMLPPNLSLDETTGQIVGVLNTHQQKEWKFGIYAKKMLYSQTIVSETRIFSIHCNEATIEHRIIWDTDEPIDLGEYHIGGMISGSVRQAKTNDGSKITYSLGNGNVPSGLKMDKDGVLSGQIQQQDIGQYRFTIFATTPYTRSSKEVLLRIRKGLGKNALKLYLRFNLEYKDEYNQLKHTLDSSKVYKSFDDKYVVSSFPMIDVATLTCYDREILSYMMDYGNPEIVRLKETMRRTYSQVDDNGNSTDYYDVIYKNVDESTYDWNPVENGSYDFETRLQELKDKTPAEFDEEARLEFNNTTYDSDANTTQTFNDEENNKVIIKTYRTDPHVVYNVFNFKNVRQMLSQPLYVYQKQGTYRYDIGSQAILKEGDDTFYQQQIYNPWCFDREVNKGVVDLTYLPEDIEMVLPLISDDDILTDDNGKSYIQFLQPELDIVSDWKRPTPYLWNPNTQYFPNDIVEYEGRYYKVLVQFTTDIRFEYDPNILQKLSSRDVDNVLIKEYYPTLDLGYYEANKNHRQVDKINELEKTKGDYWYNRDFLFHEITCEPIFNKDIEKFAVQFTGMEHKFYPKKTLQRRFQVICHTPGATVTIKTEPEFPVVDNTVYVDVGTLVSYSVSKPKYLTQAETYQIINSEVVEVTLKEKVKCSVIPYPNDSQVLLKVGSEETTDGSIITHKDATVHYTVSREGYETQSGIFTVGITGEEEDYFTFVKNIELKEMFKLTILPTPFDATVLLSCDGYKQEGNSITVRDKSIVSYTVSKRSYKSKFGSVKMVRNAELPVSLENNAYTLTVEPTPTDAKVTILCDHSLGPQQGNNLLVEGGYPITYKVEKEGYLTINGEIPSISKDTRVKVNLGKWVTYTINPIPTDATVRLECGKYEQHGNSITVPQGMPIFYTVKRIGYKTLAGEKLIYEDTTETIKLVDTNVFIAEHDDTLIFVFERNNEPFIEE